MTTNNPHILVSIVVGESPLRFMRFVQGQPVTPITIGLDGHWRIGAPGVARVHLSLLFDGQQLFVATSAPDLQAYVNGMPIDPRWWVLNAPCEVRFGQACLRVAHDVPSARPPQTGPSVGHALQQGGGSKTALDGAGQWGVQHREEPVPVGQRTQLFDPSAAAGMAPRRQTPAAGQRMAQVAGPSAIQMPPAATPAVVNPPLQAPVPPVAHRVVNVLPPIAAPPDEPPMVSTLRRPLGQGDTPPPPVAPVAPIVAPQAPAVGIDAPTMLAPKHLFVPGANVGQPARPPGPASNVVSPPNPWQQGAPPGAGFSPGPAPQIVSAGRPSRSSSPGTPSPSAAGIPAKPGSALLSAWREVSTIKKITALLLPLSFAALLWPEENPPSQVATVSAVPPAPASAAHTAKAAPSAIATAAPKPTVLAPTASAEPPPEPKPANAGAPSPADGVASARFTDDNERVALDAAFAGRWPEAVALYDRLAAAHPEDPAFRETARILRETRLQPR